MQDCRHTCVTFSMVHSASNTMLDILWSDLVMVYEYEIFLVRQHNAQTSSILPYLTSATHQISPKDTPKVKYPRQTNLIYRAGESAFTSFCGQRQTR
jgi:hypothetical protein